MGVRSLTPAILLNLKPPPTGIAEFRDASARGLSLRVFASGRATWTYRYRPRGGSIRRRLALGDFPTIGLAEARRRAARCRGSVSDGQDPQSELQKSRAAASLADLIERYLTEEVAAKKKPRTSELYGYYLRKLIAPRLGSRKAGEVTPSDIDGLHRKLGAKTPVTANRAIVALSGVYAFAARRHLIAAGYNPARGIEKFREQNRERYLSTEELSRLGRVLRTGEMEGLPWPSDRAPKKHGRRPQDRRTLLSPHVVAAFRLLLFTGCRLREILRLRWSEVDFERGLLMLPDSKTGRKAVVLNAPALQILSQVPKIGDYVILGDDPKKPRADLHKPWRLIKHHGGIEDVRIHDLRHTHASVGVGAGIGLPIIGKLLGHRHVDTTARYAHLDADPLRRASERIGGQIAAAMGDRESAAEDTVNSGRRSNAR